jgi:DNA-binding MarR family transcriptional regulator
MKSRPGGPANSDDPAAPARAPEPDYRALSEFRHQIRLFLTFSEREARDAGMEPQQHQLLLALKGLPEGYRPTIRVLAERLQLRHHTVVGLVDRLTTAKLASRRASEADGREILVRITPRGEKALRALSLSHEAELAAAGPALVSALQALLPVPLPLREPAKARRRS